MYKVFAFVLIMLQVWSISLLMMVFRIHDWARDNNDLISEVHEIISELEFVKLEE